MVGFSLWGSRGAALGLRPLGMAGTGRGGASELQRRSAYQAKRDQAIRVIATILIRDLLLSAARRLAALKTICSHGDCARPRRPRVRLYYRYTVSRAGRALRASHDTGWKWASANPLILVYHAASDHQSRITSDADVSASVLGLQCVLDDLRFLTTPKENASGTTKEGSRSTRYQSQRALEHGDSSIGDLHFLIRVRDMHVQSERHPPLSPVQGPRRKFLLLQLQLLTRAADFRSGSAFLSSQGQRPAAAGKKEGRPVDSTRQISTRSRRFSCEDQGDLLVGEISFGGNG
ncbi:hypothetical protein JHW43_008711 [Diplocarpon mali]|nr:hypothetical protein JHW43_008711 [Diplocarpon mali]